MNGDVDPWQTVTLLFLPRQFEQFEALLDQLEGRADLVGTAPLELGPDFNEALKGFAEKKNVRSVGVAIAALTRIALDWVAMNDAEHEPVQKWVQIESVFGIDAIPASVGAVVRDAIGKAAMRDEINPRHPWQLLEFLAAEYLAS